MYYGCKPEIDDKRDYKFKSKIVSAPIFPEKYEIELSEVKDQGIVNSCVAHSLATCLEKFNDNKMSTGFIYGYRPLGYNQDQGMYPREALKTIQKLGDVPYEKFNHNKEMNDIKILVDNSLEELKDIAKDFKIKSYARIYTIEEIKKCLLQNTPVPVSIPVYNDLSYDDNYIVKDPEGNLQGYHMITICGYNKTGFIFQNSWGKHWANNGKAILPYNYKIDSAWAISTENNSINTYQTILQHIYKLLLNIINIFKNKN